MKRRILSIALTICMVLMLLPITVFAANDDATDLQSLLNGGGTVTLNKDYTIDTTLEVTNPVTLDLNGYVIKMTGSGSVIKVGSGGNLTVNDSRPTATHTDASLPAGGVITGGNASRGGGVYSNSGSVTMNGGTIANCSAEDGGGVFVAYSSFTMTGGTIENCSSTTFGGGLYVSSSSSITMNGGTIASCSAERGGGVYNGNTFTMNGGTIASCSAERGGGVFNGNTFTMSGGSIANCSSTCPSTAWGGGGVFNKNTFTMSDGVIENCSAASSFGGGVYSDNAFTMRGGTIRGCSAKFAGGVRVDQGSFTLEGGTIEACTETVNGKSDAVTMSFNASLLGNGGTIKGMVVVGSNSTINTTNANGYTKFYNEVTNYGTISGGVYYGGIQNKSSGTVSGTYHTVTFDTNGGSSVPTQWLFNTNTAKALQPAAPTKEGYQAFDGWYNGDTRYDFNQPVTQDITLKAKFSNPFAYNISCDLDGGTATNPATYTVESEAITLINPVKTGYTFTGWSGTDLTGENNMTVTIPKESTGDRSYTAHWRDATAPVISGIEDGKTYCDTVEFEVSDNVGVASVTANDVTLTPDANNKYTLEKGTGTVTVVAIDKANNQTSVTVTVNDGHTAGNDDGDCSTPVYCVYHPDTVVVEAKSHDFSGEWNKDEDGHWHICQNAGCTVPDTKVSHSGTDDGDCTTAVICECGYTIKAANAEHSYSAWKSNGNGTHTHRCTVVGCSGYEDGNCTGGEATCTSKAICEYCKTEYGEFDSSNHNLEKIPAKDATVTATGNKEYWHCKDCKKYFSDAAGTNEIKLDDTVIAKLSPEIIEGKGQSITAGEKKELTFKSNAAFSDFIRVELDGKTLDEKNYTVKEGSTIVTLKADYVATLSAGEHTIGIVSTNGTATTTFTVNAKAVVDNDTKSPQTGDNSHMALWIALLFVSGAGVIGTTVYGKKKRAK